MGRLRGRTWTVALGAAAALAVGGCAAGARLERGAYVVPGKHYRVAAPPGWERIDVEGADLALRHAAHEAGLLAHGSCEGRAPTRPLPVLSRHLRFGLRDVRALAEDPIEVQGRRGIRSRLDARLDGRPVSVVAVSLLVPPCVYDLVLVAPPAALDAVVGDFARFTEGFRVTGPAP